ncbi:MAG TPA: hypothetical protein VFQ63_01190 [Patescibacteria group bacterium]|nr:hypothetical protein [Patescibacteria group bacterium]
MKKILTIFLLSLLLLFSARSAFAIENPLSSTNNKFGIHILFPSELSDAAKLVNSNGGDWGYVTIPIQAGDKDRAKWQDFLNQCGQLHLIPILRLATEGDYFNTTVWRKPNFLDVLDFANFLGDLHWPVKNRYIIVFNEVNRGDEWGGQPNSGEYADILSYAVTAFKTKNPDFFVISAGLDNAAANSSTAINEYTFLSGMNNAIPGIFNQIDGFGSHSYPNPGFSTPPGISNTESIASFKYEKQLISQNTSKDLPVFITETGWTRDSISDAQIASYYQTAFSTTWNDPSIAAITPFLLKAGAGPFQNFSMENNDGSLTAAFKLIESLPKPKGAPHIVPQVLAAETKTTQVPTAEFAKSTLNNPAFTISSNVKAFLKWLLHY